MSLNINVINWDELIAELQDKIEISVNGTFDLEPTNKILKEYLPQIRELIQQILQKKAGIGTQRIKGEHLYLTGTGSGILSLEPQTSILLTGITYGQSMLSGQDRFDLVVIFAEQRTVILDGIYAKDTVQDKKFMPPILVPIGGKVELTAYHERHVPMDITVDFEYAEIEIQEGGG